eukprot:GHVQ01018967.1.p1 GENE.GHVQ01018967.1~~GHVQ01018967.1.p1  ORF type:complete len:192 (+),score=27.01 GHVQ01018967.1:135-710(+)
MKCPPAVTFCTGNANKLKEVQEILGSSVVLTASDVHLPELQGDPTDIATEKCLLAYNIVKGPVCVEDTSLCFNALHGLPGPYIKWFTSKMGVEEVPKLLAGYEDKTAEAVCIFSYCDCSLTKPVTFKGTTEGRIVSPPRGSQHFGWDAIFEPTGYDETYAELPSETKHTISHRYKALLLLRMYLTERNSSS